VFVGQYKHYCYLNFVVLEYLKKIHKSNKTFFILFDNDRKIHFFNDAFAKKFEIKDKNAFIGKKFDFIYQKDNAKIIPFSSLSINKILKGSQVYSYFPEDNKEYFYYVCTFYAGETKNIKFYYSILKEITDIEKKLMDQSIQALVIASQLKDNDTGNHVKRINAYSYCLSRHLYETRINLYPEIDEDFIDEISRVASMHDVGKIGTPDSILTKPARLTEEEFNIIKDHTLSGAFILSKMVGQMARDIALFHHERWDGSGYPYQLKEDQIPVCARIVSIADVYDALRMARIYKEAQNHKQVKKFILSEKGKHFDPHLVESFIEIEDKFEDIYEKLEDKTENLRFHKDLL